ncbi:hypothetical protein NDA18_000736 [Ustilago nuda]|nr:hypothetical protein NDA18_000736 [Ustilago nuda]
MNVLYYTRSQAAAVAAPPPPPCQHRIVARLHPREDSGPTPETPLSPVPARVADPLASPVALRSPLEPLFLGTDDDIIPPSPLSSPFLAPTPYLVGIDRPPISLEIDLYEVDAGHPTLEVSTLERQAAWEAELARSPTPPPATDDIIDAVLQVSRANTPVFRPVVQPLTPPPRWVGRQTPPPPPPDRHLPTNGEIAGWSKQFFVAELMARIADQYFPLDWDVPVGSLVECHLHRLVMLRLTEGCTPWPSWQCHWCFNLGTPIPRACTHCYLAGLGHCERTIPAHLGMEYPGDGTPHMQPRGSHQVEWAHLTMGDGDGPGLVRSQERTLDPVMTQDWVTAMRVIWHLR